MDAEAETERAQIAEQDPEDEPIVAACETSPGKTVFTEKGNTDAWIATDLTVSPEQ